MIFVNKGEERLREALTDPVGPAEQTESLMGSAAQTGSPRDTLIQPSFTNGQFLRNYLELANCAKGLFPFAPVQM